VLGGANGAHQNQRLPQAQSHAITAQMQGKQKVLSALKNSNTTICDRVAILSDNPAVNEDGSPRAPITKKKKTGKDPTKTSAVAKKTAKAPAVALSDNGKTVTMSKGYWRTKLQSATVLKRDKAELDAIIVTQKENLKQTQNALTLVTEGKTRLVTQNRDLRMEVVDLQNQIKANRDKNGSKSTLL